jgi:uncharacterized membrane protein
MSTMPPTQVRVTQGVVVEIFSDWGNAGGGLYFLSKYGHVLFGIAWIGLLYFFNFVQVPAYAELSAGARTEAFDKVTWRALWWFRMAAAATFVTGALMWSIAGGDYSDAGLLSISWGSILGTTMFLNVWGIIWRNQKVNITSMRTEGKPNADAAKKAARASRANALFSIPMLFFMVFTSHFAPRYDVSGGKVAIAWIIFLAIWAFIEASAIGLIGGLDSPFNKWAFDTHKNTIIAGVAYWLILLVICWELIIGGF